MVFLHTYRRRVLGLHGGGVRLACEISAHSSLLYTDMDRERQTYEATLYGHLDAGAWRDMCRRTPAIVHGTKFTGAMRCYHQVSIVDLACMLLVLRIIRVSCPTLSLTLPLIGRPTSLWRLGP